MRKQLILILMILSVSLYAREKEDINIGVIFTEPLYLQEDENFYQTEFKELMKSRYNVEFPEEFQKEVHTEAEIKEAYDELLANDGVDAILNLGIIASYYGFHYEGEYTKPVLSPFVLTSDEMGGTTKRKNFSYISSNKKTLGTGGSLDLIGNWAEYKKLIYITSPESNTFAPVLNDSFLEGLKSNGFSVELVSTTAEDLYTKIDESDFIYFGTIMNRDIEVKNEVLLYAKELKKPTFTFLLSTRLPKDMLLGYDASEEYKKRIRRIALNLENALRGEEISELPNTLDTFGGQLIINSGLAREINFWLPQEITQNAKVVDYTRDSYEYLPYEKALEISLEQNISKKIQELNLAKSEYEFKSAKSTRRPDLNLYGGYNALDDQSANRLTTTAKNEVKAGVSLKQVIYNEDVNAGVDIFEGLYNKTEIETRAQELDTILDTSKAYINILQAQALVNIYSNALELGKEYLNLAKVRKNVGISDSSEIYRFESEVANAQSDLTNAMATLDNTKMNLNRVLNIDINSTYRYEDLARTNEFLIGGAEDITKAFTTPWEFNYIKDFMVQLGLENSYDIKALDELVKVKERELKNSQRSMYSPEVALTADYSVDLVDPWGTGDKDFNGNSIEAEDEWKVGLVVSLPIYEGGSRSYEKGQKEAELEAVLLQLEAEKARYTQETQNLLNELVAKYADVINRTKAAGSAKKNLDLVTDNYASGTTTIIALLDARTNAIAAAEQEVAAKYDFLKKKLEVERQLGIYEYQLTEDEKMKIITDYQAYREEK